MKLKKKHPLSNINAITLSDKMKWWQSDGNFNAELYLKCCYVKNRIPD